MGTRSVKCAALLAAVVVVQVGLGGPAWAAKGKTLREAYVGSASVFNPSRCQGCGITYPSGLCRPGAESGGAGEPFNPTGKNVGRVCFTGLTSPGKYKVTVLDVSGQDLGFTYVWNVKGNWTEYGAEPACKTATLTKPSWATRLEIFLGEPFVGPGGVPIYCQRNGLPSTPGFPTTGEVTLTTPARSKPAR
jgi:hypothetical protein